LNSPYKLGILLYFILKRMFWIYITMTKILIRLMDLIMIRKRTTEYIPKIIQQSVFDSIASR